MTVMTTTGGLWDATHTTAAGGTVDAGVGGGRRHHPGNAGDRGAGLEHRAGAQDRRPGVPAGAVRARRGQRGQETLPAGLGVALVLLPGLVSILTPASMVHTGLRP